MAEAYGRFLEMPVPVVLVTLWLFGVLLLGLVVGALMLVAYLADALLSAAIGLA
jgi:cytochrome c-type biogenesis protein CcmH/NrfF